MQMNDASILFFSNTFPESKYIAVNRQKGLRYWHMQVYRFEACSLGNVGWMRHESWRLN